ncbi:hypothetical protein PAPYR_9219 [Paratrimastix pyriformis]|uniref:SET domain-containing protein n=1 Tax=Paratrimastix pyriformis TaxID=342808 RepID=A0ABQ8U8T4_9EUKA|nr:hypothetical protein PAPYR_9219 [Paratrimastix pyriformis]
MEQSDQKTVPPESVDDLKKRGNDAYKNHLYREASLLYDQALGLDPGNATVRANRATSRYASGFYAEALDDALFVLKLRPEPNLIAKCHQRAAAALIQLHRAGEATHREAVRKDPSLERLVQEMGGDYDRRSMIAEPRELGNDGRLPPYHLDNYTSEVVLRCQPHGKVRGGAFAQGGLPKGKLLMARRALAYVPYNPNPTPPVDSAKGTPKEGLANPTPPVDSAKGTSKEGPASPLEAKTAQFILEHPDRADEVYSLPAGPGFDLLPAGYHEVVPDRIRAICSRNGFDGANLHKLAVEHKDMAEQEKKRLASGLWGLQSQFNHSSVPNCAWEIVGDFLFVRTIRPVRAGEELCVSYGVHLGDDVVVPQTAPSDWIHEIHGKPGVFEGQLPPKEDTLFEFGQACDSWEALSAKPHWRYSFDRIPWVPAAVPTVPPLDGLRPITIRDCVKQCYAVHAGQVLRATVIQKPCSMVATHLLLQDAAGNVIVLAIYHLSDPSDFEPGTRVAVIEPYAKFTQDNTALRPFLRTDNPQTVVVEKSTQKKSLFERANAAFTKRLYRTASKLLTQVLSQEPGNVAALDKRADSLLSSGYCSTQALYDALHVLHRQPEHTSCFYLAAEALIRLDCADEAYMDALRRADSEQNRELLAALDRLQGEMKNGHYDRYAMATEQRTDGRLPSIHRDAFTSSKVAFKATSKKGRGGFAQVSLPEGELLVASRALAFVPYDRNALYRRINWEITTEEKMPALEQGPECQLASSTVQFLLEYPERAHEVYRLTAGSAFDRLPAPSGLDLARIHALCRLNRFNGNNYLRCFVRYGKPIADLNFSSGLWGPPSQFNHSCAPNCTWEVVGDFMFVRTIRPVEAEEELCVSYRFFSVPERGYDGCLCDWCASGEPKSRDPTINFDGSKDPETSLRIITGQIHQVRAIRPVWDQVPYIRPALSAFFKSFFEKRFFEEARLLIGLVCDICHDMGAHPVLSLPYHLYRAWAFFVGDPDESKRILRALRRADLAILGSQDFCTAVETLGLLPPHLSDSVVELGLLPSVLSQWLSANKEQQWWPQFMALVGEVAAEHLECY